MTPIAATLTPRTIPPGIVCQCGAGRWRQRYIDPPAEQPLILICEQCLTEIELPPGHQMRPAPVDASDEALAPPTDRQQWIGYVRGLDSAFLPVALTRTLASCWDALLHYPTEGDLLCRPTDAPPRGWYTTGDPQR